MTPYALNLFDLADNDLYRRYSPRSANAVGKHGGRIVALGRLSGVQEGEPDVELRMVLVLVEWPSRQSSRALLEDPELADCPRYARAGCATTCGGLRALGGPTTHTDSHRRVARQRVRIATTGLAPRGGLPLAVLFTPGAPGEQTNYLGYRGYLG